MSKSGITSPPLIDEAKIWSEFSKELARKATEIVSDIIFKVDNKEVSTREAFVAIDAVYDVISGLVPWDVASLIYGIREEIKNA